MTPERHTRVSELFLEVRELDSPEREPRLRELCTDDPSLVADVLELLEHEGSSAEIRARAELPAGEVEQALAAWEEAEQPDRIGSYELLEPLGRGAMGVVYEARHPRLTRTVALKWVRPLLDPEAAGARFVRETELVSKLSHPGIAAVFDAGIDDGPAGPRPWYAMERVEGPHLDEHCREHALDLHARVRLVAELADAVHHAHQHGVLHRDLKPSNIRVDADGRPKVLDFGVAGVLADDGRLRDLPAGTPRYMSPEQLAGEALDVRADVYALGVILRELIVGGEVAQRRSVDAIPVELRAVLDQALALEREQRPPSASEFGRDLHRFLEARPVAARTQTGPELALLFTRRNPALVGGGVAVFVTLLAGLIVSTVFWSKARADQLRAEKSEEAAGIREREALTAAAALRRASEALAESEAAERSSRQAGGSFASRSNTRSAVNGRRRTRGSLR